jgi:pimeloyl-ACP methyl ester carboxylesterase
MIGLRDRNAGVDVSRDLAMRLPGGALHVFAHSAHMPHDEEPDEYVAVVAGVLALTGMRVH